MENDRNVRKAEAYAKELEDVSTPRITLFAILWFINGFLLMVSMFTSETRIVLSDSFKFPV